MSQNFKSIIASACVAASAVFVLAPVAVSQTDNPHDQSSFEQVSTLGGSSFQVEP